MRNYLLTDPTPLPAVPVSTVEHCKRMELEMHVSCEYGTPGGYDITECVSLDQIVIKGNPKDYLIPRYLWSITRRHVDPDTGEEWDRAEHYEQQNEALRSIALMVNDLMDEAFVHGRSVKVEVHYVQHVSANEALDHAYCAAVGLIEGCRTFWPEPDEDGDDQPVEEESWEWEEPK